MVVPKATSAAVVKIAARIETRFPGREVRMLDMSAILNGGGLIRHLTQPVPM